MTTPHHAGSEAPADSGWVAFADALPTDDQSKAGLWVFDPTKLAPRPEFSRGYFNENHPGLWQPATVPAPPPKALSLQERDAAEFSQWAIETNRSIDRDSRIAYMAGRKHERQEVRALLECGTRDRDVTMAELREQICFDPETWRKLAERVGLKP